MHPEVERDLTHLLLVELLAHQFAFPVRWIESQHAILGDIGAERIVEVGPANILTNMMKRTWGQAYAARDDAQGVRRRILGPEGDLPEIYYRCPTDTDDAPAASTEHTSLSHESSPTNSHDSPCKTLTSVVPEVPEANIPVPAVLIAIIAAKLRKTSTSIDQHNTINQLVGGRSALSNEIIGDLHEEFGNHLPDHAEELSLNELCEVLEKNHTGRLGKTATGLVSNMLSSKFPGDFGPSKVRKYLRDKWGFGPLRQDSLFVAALAKQPAARMASVDLVMTFLDDVANTFFQQQGLSLPTSSSSDTFALVDAKALQVLNEQKNPALLREISDAIAKHLGINETSVEGNENTANMDLDVWLDEHGDDYAQGIKPIFDVKKQRVYDSFWNWNSQDISVLFQLTRQCNPLVHVNLIEDLLTSIVNRSCDRSLAQLQFLCTKSSDLGGVMWSCLEACSASKTRNSVFIDRSPDLAPLTTIDVDGKITFCEVPRKALLKRCPSVSIPKPFFPSVQIFSDGVSTVSEKLCGAYAEDLDTARHSGFSFRGRNILLTGAGKNSIGIDILKFLLQGGGRVTVATSSYSAETTKMYQAVYARHGAKDSVLRVLPFNQGSRRDVEGLVQHNTDEWDLDFIIPFAAVSESGRDIEEIDSKSEIAHRLMLTNLLRLLGAVARTKRLKGINTRPATAVLPLSPNHGLMGSDGLYSESKRALEPLLAKWKSESWHDYLSVLGVIIAWTRGTGLMDDNDVVAQGIESLGARTFSRSQMATYIVSLMGGEMSLACQSAPLVVDLSGGLGKVSDLKEMMTRIRRDLRTEADIKRAIRDEDALDAAAVAGQGMAQESSSTSLSPRANIQLQLPVLPNYQQDLSTLSQSLEGMVDLSRVVVITGFAELGPYGNSRTRWEMEAEGILSLEGCIEMAWMMGMIKYQKNVVKDGSPWSGWVDAKTLAPVEDADIQERYTEAIFQHTGIRKIEPEICDNSYDPEKKTSVHEIILQRDLPPFEATPEVAWDFQNQHGHKVVISRTESGSPTVQLKAGAAVLLPKASRFNRTVAGQIPTGWSAKRYGIEDDIVEQVDPVTLFALVCTVEALLSSGIVDPYELYQHVHLSEVGSCIGSSMGGLSSLRKMHRDRFLDRQVQGDILQETFVNTTGAWINMLLMSSTGPIKTAVGACATSLESLDTGYDLIVQGKVKICLVGGVEDFVEDVSYEFGSMNATCNTDHEFAAGRSPQEMSRPMASSRSGFVESQGCGIQVLTTAELALKMGLPIFGVVAYTSMAADKVGRSVPAPDKGILTNARELHDGLRSNIPSPLLDINYRRRLRDLQRRLIAENYRSRMALLEHEIDCLKREQPEGFDEEQYRLQNSAPFEEEARRQDTDVIFNLGNQFWKKEKQISPIRGSLATWGLGIDDLAIASLHGTSTVQNDLNETMVIQEQMKYLGRQEGNLLPCVCQKWLTGHAKGAAGAWMVNGCLQMMASGLIPGNRNVDNVDSKLRQHHYLQFSSVSIQTEEVKACSVTSFGFGQKGSQALLVHPKYLFATIPQHSYQDYSLKRHARWQRACQHLNEGMIHETIVTTKTVPPYDVAHQSEALLDPTARF